MANLQALQTLLKLQSPTNVGSLTNHGLDIASGMDQFGPTEGELTDAQLAEGDAMSQRTGGYGYSGPREEMRSDVMGKIRKMLSLGQIEAQQKLQQATQPEIIKGEYGVRQAAETAKAAEARAQSNQDAMAQRQQQMIEAIGGRQDKTLAGQAERQQMGIDARAQRINPQGMSAITRERAALQTQAKTQEPGALMKMFGRTNPMQAKLDALDNAQQWALKIAREQPGISTEEALAQYGQSPSPEEAALVERFRLMLQGQ